MIAWLHEYAAAGVFPRDDAGRPLSVFRDTHGVRCPMAELIFRSGHADLVDQVATTHNNLRLADVHSGPLYAWILASGLTQEEVVDDPGRTQRRRDAGDAGERDPDEAGSRVGRGRGEPEDGRGCAARRDAVRDRARANSASASNQTSFDWNPGNEALSPLGFGTTNTRASPSRSGLGPGPGAAPPTTTSG